jgi:CheY-like chemotaxis protein
MVLRADGFKEIGMSKKLLLADDSITIQKVIQITFAHEDYDLTVTDNGDTALVKAQEIKPDLVLSDVYMPGKNGYELTAAIKEDPALQHIPVLLLAGSFEPFDEDKARSCKADAWIEKPFESQSLIDKVAELLTAAPDTPVSTAPAIEAEPVAEIADTETPLPTFDEPATAEPAQEPVSEDPFGDISFDDEVPVVAPEPVAAADDWSDVAVEPQAVSPIAEEPETQAVDDFSFAEETPAAAEAFTTEEPSVAEVADLDAFDMGDDEIMPLGDDDILEAEDLEPALPEQTLAAWSRSEAEDVFAEELEETPLVVAEPVDEAPLEPAFAEEPPSVEVPVAEPVIEETVAETVFEEAPAEAVEAAVVPASVDVEEKVSALSEDDIEQIIEKVVTGVVERLAGSILERVAWEVVPDLAENLIREEIRKIKDAAA